MIALPLVGIPLSMLSVFGGALGVGLGFGLQKIASNYVSGFIVLLDRAVRIGDLVQIDTRQGTVTAITARYVVLKLSDGSEAIIPNETLITSTVLNLSYNDRRQRLTVAVPVAHEADLGRALTLMSEQAMQDLRLLEAPPPQAIIKAMSRDCIELELGFWIEDPSLGAAAIKSDLYLAITSAFRDAGIPPPAVRTG
jgi:small-conductance mechanosensitive channel